MIRASLERPYMMYFTNIMHWDDVGDMETAEIVAEFCELEKESGNGREMRNISCN